MKLLTIFTALIMSQTVFAGSGWTQFNCKSDSGRTTLKGSLPTDSVEYKLTLSVDGKEIEYSSQYNDATHDFESNAEVVEVQSFKNKVFTLSLVTKDSSVLQLFALPNTIKDLSSNRWETKTKFKAIVPAYSMLDPRENGEYFDKDIYVNCDYEYGI